ncbi:hypothetical protein BGY98DRAFT_80207 [Russula aff. rugulosa BPL654]|nr:hypothetical protein BGY98DRAFT_80207 [Russula aff. rugulosa BPL654]
MGLKITHAAHLPDRTISPMTVSLDSLRSAIYRPNGSLRAVNGPSYSAPTGQPDSDRDVYGQHLGPSAESLDSGCSSAPNLCDFGESQYTTGSEPYPAWGAKRNIPLSKEEIEGIFLDLQQEFGFQRGLMWNMFDFTMHLLDSRASRMSPN